MKQIIKKSFCFIANKAGVVSIEIAFIASSFILLIMGIVEYSVIFSLRGGLE
ncbi:MAG: Flp pilus assembly protein TadG, partial [Alphaproteobacteria bacterium]